MPTIEQISHFFATYWPALLALGSVTTFINGVVKRLPDTPALARLKNIVNTVTVDYAALLAELGGAFGVGPRKADKSVMVVTQNADGSATMTKTRITPLPKNPTLLIGLVAALLLTGCGGESLQQLEAKALPVLTQAQVLAVQVQNALDVAEKAGVTPESLAAAKDAIGRGEFGEAVDLAYKALKAAADAGVDVPKEVVAALEVTRIALAVQGLQAGMTAVSK